MEKTIKQTVKGSEGLEKILQDVAKVLKSVGEETEDALEAFCSAVFEGEDARERSQDLGGSPVPERMAFEVGLIAGPVLKAALAAIIKDGLRKWIKV